MGRSSAGSGGRDRKTPIVLTIGFVVMLLAAAWLGWVSRFVVLVYLVASVVTLGVYGWDKLAAKQGRRRTPEASLLLLGFVGGWPGGLLAQRLWRHKTRKAAFLRAFWATVVLNVALLGYVVWSGDEGFLARLLRDVLQQ